MTEVQRLAASAKNDWYAGGTKVKSRVVSKSVSGSDNDDPLPKTTSTVEAKLSTSDK